LCISVTILKWPLIASKTKAKINRIDEVKIQILILFLAFCHLSFRIVNHGKKERKRIKK